MKHKVCVMTGTRADYGVLRELLFKLKNNSKIDLELLVTGTHLSEEFGNTQVEIKKDGFVQYASVAIPINDDSKGGMAYATGVAVTQFAEYFKDNICDLLVVLGDRFEALAVTVAANLSGIPIAHISGGDVTEGAVDDAIRHSITKMSQLHFPGCEQSAKRIIQMGEQPTCVFNVGEPGIENCVNMQLLSRAELAESIEFEDVLENYSVVTFHPVTMENNTGVEQVKELIAAMDAIKDMSYIITLANADAGGRAINDLWIREGEKRKHWYVIPSLGVLRYLSAMKYAKAVIGNSSSGIIEAPAMGVPTVNIGDRQKGRMISESVICCEPMEIPIVEAIKMVIKDTFQERAKQVVSPFGNGTTSIQIEQHIVEFLENKNKTLTKHFYDIEFDY